MKLVISFFLLWTSWGVQAEELISSSAGRVKGYEVTTRETLINFFIEEALFGKKKKNSSIAVPKIKSAEFSSEVTNVLLEWVVHLEAKGFTVAQVKTSEVNKAYSKVSQFYKSYRPWRKLKTSLPEIRKIIKRKLQSKKFIQFKIKSSMVPVTEGESREYFDKNRIKFGSSSFEQSKETIKTHLSQMQVNRRLKDWFEVLQAKYKVRNYLREI